MAHCERPMKSESQTQVDLWLSCKPIFFGLWGFKFFGAIHFQVYEHFINTQFETEKLMHQNNCDEIAGMFLKFLAFLRVSSWATSEI